jgi:hypothetical protein
LRSFCVWGQSLDFAFTFASMSGLEFSALQGGLAMSDETVEIFGKDT